MPTNLPRLIRKLGEGGMGEVWLAEDDARGTVAVKQLHPGLLDGDSLSRFRSEFASLARLRHPNLVEAYDYFVYPSGRHGYTMEFVPGLDFTAATGGLDAIEIVRLAEQVCEALEHVHSHDLIHGDVKPGNLQVRNGAVKLMDFGLAERPGPRGVRGSLDYLAPEVIQGRPRDRRADLYALGAVLFEALTRHTPFHGASRFALLRAHLRSHPEFPARSLELIPEPVRRVVLRLLCKDPSARFFTAAETAEALRAAIGAGGKRELRPEGIGGSGAVAGREREVGALEQALREAGAGASPQAIIVEGPAGSGKGALLRAFAAQLHSRRVAHAWATGAQGAPPLAAAREWLAELSRHVTPEWPRLRAAIVAIDAGAPGAPRAAAFALESAARRVPLVLFMNAAEWADEASAALVATLRLSPRARFLFAGAATSSEGIAPWTGMPRLVLRPLDAAATAEIARDATGALRVEPAFSSALHAATGGYPGAARACLRALAAEGALSIRDGVLHSSAPPTGGPGLERVLAFLGTDARIAAEALAVLARPATQEEVAIVAGLAPDRAANALFDLERRGIASRTDAPSGPRARLSAPALSRPLFAAAPPDGLRVMHRAAAALDRAAALPESAARHLFEAGDGAPAVAAAIEAARHASGASPREAASLLERAFAHPECPPEDRASARLLLSECLERAGNPGRASQLLEEISVTAPADQREQLLLRAARLAAAQDPTRSLALLETLPPSPDLAVQRAGALYAAGRFLESLQEARALGTAAAQMTSARALLALGRYQEAHAAALARAETLAAAGDRVAAASAALVAAEAAFARNDAGGAACASALASTDSLDSASLEALSARAVSSTLRSPPGEALAAWRRIAELARVSGDADALARAATGAARLHSTHDRLGEAADAAEEAVGAHAPDRRLRFEASLAACEAAARLGRHHAARMHADAAVEAAAPSGPSRSLAAALAARARAALAAGDLDAALAAGRASRDTDPSGDPLAFLEIALAHGNAQEVLSAAPRVAPASERDAARLAALRARALAASGEPIGLAAAVDEFYGVLGRARDLGSTSLARRAHAGLGRALHALHLGRSARDHLRLALDLLRDALTHVPQADQAAFLALPENAEVRSSILLLTAE